MKVAVLGAGRVGRAMAPYLAKEQEFEVAVVDMAPEALEPLEEITG
jgi:saccharopine dehydrogenase-like NADP-dependent oxidoreductase